MASTLAPFSSSFMAQYWATLLWEGHTQGQARLRVGVQSIRCGMPPGLPGRALPPCNASRNEQCGVQEETSVAGDCGAHPLPVTMQRLPLSSSPASARTHSAKKTTP